jgi:hypothetical protein
MREALTERRGKTYVRSSSCVLVRKLPLYTFIINLRGHAFAVETFLMSDMFLTLLVSMALKREAVMVGVVVAKGREARKNRGTAVRIMDGDSLSTSGKARLSSAQPN